MSHHISKGIDPLLQAMGPFMKFFNEGTWANRTSPGMDFVAGNPQELPLPELTEAIRRWAVPKDKDWYAYKLSEEVARVPAAAGLRERTGVAFEAEDIAMTTGGFAGISVSLRAVLDPGDEVIFLSPPWFFYEAMIVACGAEPVRVKIAPPAFDLPIDEISAAITSKTRAILVNTPHNPSGRMYSREDLEHLAAVLSEASEKNGRPLYLLSDEPYNRIVYDGNQHVSPATVYQYSFLIYSYGKQLLAPGERMGYIALPPDMPDRESMRTALIAQQMMVGWALPNAIQQYALADIDDLTIDLEHLQRKRDHMVEGLREAGYELHVPEGTFYLLPKSPFPDDWALVERLAQDEVYVLPGAVVELPGYFRISVTASEEMIEGALPIFAKVFAEATG